MTQYTGFGHCATELINVSAQRAFDYLADPLTVGTWSLGCMRTQSAAAPGSYFGFSLYDDSQVGLEVRAHRDLLLIDYLVGAIGALRPRVSIRIAAAETCDLAANQCYVSLMAWRGAHMSQERWSQLCTAHEAEIWLIRARLEGAAPR
jgi:hypothetical protein